VAGNRLVLEGPSQRKEAGLDNLRRPAFAALRSRSAFTLNLISSPPPCSANSHFSTGTSTGAPLFLIKTTSNFAGLVLLAFRSTT
jgi:hypothetical protein